MGEIVVDRDVVHRSTQLHPAPHSLEGAQPLCKRVGAQPDGGPHRDRGERIADVIRAQQRQFETAYRLPAAPDAERGGRPRHFDVVALPVCAGGKAKRLDWTGRTLPQLHRFRIVCPEEQQAASRNEVHEPGEGQPDGVEVRVDIGVVELDVVHDGDIGEILQELGCLVEEGAVVFVPLDDELAAAAHAVTALEVLRDPADEHAGIGSAVREQPARQRRRRRFPMCPGDDDGACAPEKVIAHGFRQRAVADLAVQHLLELGVPARDGVADDDQVDVRGDVFCRVPAQRDNPLRLQEVTHRRVDVLVGAPDVVPTALEEGGQGAHRGAADANEVNACHV